MIVGLDKLTQGQPVYNLGSYTQERYTGYFQLDHGRYYWQLNGLEGMRWVKKDRKPEIINYSRELTI